MGSFLSKVKKLHTKPKTPEEPQKKYTLPSRDIYTFTKGGHHDTYPEISSPNTPCAGKAVLVTGSNRGLGRAILLSFARSGASKLALCSRQPCPDVADELRTAALKAGHPEPEVLELTIDVTSQAQIDAAAQELEAKWGRLDILINNSGYMPMDCFSPLGSANRDEYDHTWDVNFMGAIRVTRAFLPILLKEGKDGAKGDRTIIHSVSVGALYPEGGGESYSLSKFALCRSSEYLSTQYANEGLISYVIHPGGILTELATHLPKAFHSILNDTEELAGDSVVFLSHKRREWLAGRFVNCNWDLPELMGMEEEIVEHNLLKFKCAGLQ